MIRDIMLDAAAIVSLALVMATIAAMILGGLS
jgi:hypothetical protein